MDVDISAIENRIDLATPELAVATLTDAANQARKKAGDLDEAAARWRQKGVNAQNSKHTANLAAGFFARANACAVDADAVRATAAAWDQQASNVVSVA